MGQWLERAGFSIDTPITVRVMEGCLVLTHAWRFTCSESYPRIFLKSLYYFIPPPLCPVNK
ncbi:MAG: SymE family type I addiction module toxin [Sedimenticola sp.]